MGDWVGSRGCECFECINETPFQEELRLLKTIGWSAKYVTVSCGKDGRMLDTDAEQINRDIVESIDKGCPILSRRINNHRYSITIGYEDDGASSARKRSMERAPQRAANTGMPKPSHMQIGRRSWWIISC